MPSIIDHISDRTTAELQQNWRDLGAHTPEYRWREFSERIVHELAKRGEVPNPIVKTTALRAYPGWHVHGYADGTFVIASGTAWACVDTFDDALYFARHGEPRI